VSIVRLGRNEEKAASFAEAARGKARCAVVITGACYASEFVAGEVFIQADTLDTEEAIGSWLEVTVFGSGSSGRGRVADYTGAAP
jgi:hypothetical protein